MVNISQGPGFAYSSYISRASDGRPPPPKKGVPQTDFPLGCKQACARAVLGEDPSAACFPTTGSLVFGKEAEVRVSPTDLCSERQGPHRKSLPLVQLPLLFSHGLFLAHSEIS